MTEQIINLSDDKAKARLVEQIQRLDGVFRVKIAKYQRRRSLLQNAYYWGCVLPCLAAGLHEAWGETLTPEEVHEFCKHRWLRRPVVDKNTGEVMGMTMGHTPKLNTKEFTEYLEKIMQFAAESLSVVIPSPYEEEYSDGKETAGTPRAVRHPGRPQAHQAAIG